MKNIEIKLGPIADGTAQIKIGDVDVSEWVTGIDICGRVGELTRVDFSVICADCQVEASAGTEKALRQILDQIEASRL